MSKFQIIALVVFGFMGVSGIIAFATFQSSTNNNDLPEVVMWGVLDEDVMRNFFSSASVRETGAKVTYIEKSVSSFENDFLEAVASGSSPDLVLFPHELIASQGGKLMTIPWESYPERDFKDTYVDGAEIFTNPEGILGIPFVVDPLILYWNRNDFRNANVTLPPKFWDEFFTLAPKFLKKDSVGNVQKSFVALGEYSNVSNAKEILSLLMFQAGTPITQTRYGKLESVLDERFNYPTPPAEAALRFYIEFSNSAKPSYSWNKSLPLSRDAFSSERVAVYLGFGSELSLIRARNPNLNFDVSTVPQIRDSSYQFSYGKMYALSIPRASLKIDGAYKTALALSSPAISAEFSNISNLSPLRRDSLSISQQEAYRTTLYRSAVISRAWLDPKPSLSGGIFSRMVESSVSGKETVSSAVDRASSELTELINN